MSGPPIIPGSSQPPTYPGPPQPLVGPPPRAARKFSPLKIVLLVGALFIVVCVAPVTLIATLGGKAPANPQPTQSAEQRSTLSVTAAGTTAPPTTATTLPEPTTAAAPPPPPPTTTTEPPNTEPAPEPTQQGVTPGAFCSPHYAYGLTVKSVLMQCKPSATDTRFRWRAV
jgi:type IV secretory pathway VirB10-like protein